LDDVVRDAVVHESDKEDAVFPDGCAFAGTHHPLLRDAGRNRQSNWLKGLLLLKEEYKRSIQTLLYTPIY
jgi:hypothetical protein